MANRLAKEKSVYLQQHASNPVDWYPWGQEALEKARTEGKPLLVSIGYSTCHWCHVMEHESFESREVAAILNDKFVAIKVDREELPDVDECYMEAVQALTGRGGWPLNVFITPDLKPFFGGTYFPKHTFLRLIENIGALWEKDRARIEEQAEQILQHTRGNDIFAAAAPATDLARLRGQKKAWNQKLLEFELEGFDETWGGFGNAPKFPRAHGLSALLRAALDSDDSSKKSEGLEAVAHTLRGMAYGGLRDQLRGGFHRYSTDERWHVPHFEKMLYDQALLIEAYSEGYRTFREDFFADIVEETLDYLEAEMRLSNGLFAAAQDADSEGVEGKFFVWTRDAIDQAFQGEPPELIEKFCALHSVRPEGNWEHGENVLCLPLATAWSEVQNPEMKRLRLRLRELRAQRVAPIRDAKALVSWNAWLAAALYRASLNVADRGALAQRLAEAGHRTAAALRGFAKGDDLPRVIYDGVPHGRAYLEDYAAYVEALQAEALAKRSAAGWAESRAWIQKLEQKFRGADGVLRSRQPDCNPDLPVKGVDFQDGATPSALSSCLVGFYRQALADADAALHARATEMVARLERVLEQAPTAVSYLLAGLESWNGLHLKIPKPAQPAFETEWQTRQDFAGSLIPTLTDGALWEACDLEVCLASGTSLKDVWRPRDPVKP